MWPFFFNPSTEVVTFRLPSSWMVHDGYIFVADSHPSRTWMSGSVESVRRNAYVHWLDLGLYSHPKEFWGNEVRTHVNSKGKIPSTGSSEEGRPCDAALHRTASPTHYRLSYSGPLFSLTVRRTTLELSCLLHSTLFYSCCPKSSLIAFIF